LLTMTTRGRDFEPRNLRMSFSAAHGSPALVVTSMRTKST
jgi:hypothetical protein